MDGKMTWTSVITPSMCDASGRLGVPNSFDLFMDMASLDSDRIGNGVRHLLPKGRFWVTTKTLIRFHKRPQIMDRVELSTWPEGVEGIKGLKGGVPVVIKPEVVLLIVLLAAVTILISSFTPAIRAARVMPIDALRESNVIKVKARKLRVNPLIRRIFGYEGELAYKNIKRNGIKGKVITFTISASVILFLTISYFSDSINRVNRYDFSLPCELMVTCAYDEREEVRGMLEHTEEIP